MKSDLSSIFSLSLICCCCINIIFLGLEKARCKVFNTFIKNIQPPNTNGKYKIIYIFITEIKCDTNGQRWITFQTKIKQSNNTTSSARMIIEYVTLWIMNNIWDCFQSNTRRCQLYTMSSSQLYGQTYILNQRINRFRRDDKRYNNI